MPLNLLLAWWNLIYIVPFALALFYLGLFVFTGITFGDADVEADVDADLDADATLQVDAHVVDMDADADVDADMDHDANLDHDADANNAGLIHTPHGPAFGSGGGRGAALLAHAHTTEAHDAGEGAHDSPFLNFLTLLGIGKIPLSLALMIFLLSWGVVGFALNALLAKWLAATLVIPLISMPLTLLISLALTGLAAAAIAKIIPNDESTRQRRSDLVGKPGEAIYDIDATFGMANVRGDAGDLFQVPCRTAAGKPPIPKGARIVLFNYDQETGVFHVAPFDA